ncbi:MAG: DnaB helicase C-terminal domain-containing protein [Opitutus sp.]|nr:DnaB helicase C-terminal domain-containing protein [Opitutus sp.]
MFGKIAKGELVVLAARPSVGKSSLARQVAGAMAAAGLEVQFNSLEVPSWRVAMNMAAAVSGISVKDLRRAHERDQELFRCALAGLKLPNLHIFDADRSVAEIIAHAKMIKARRGKLDVLMIDYLGLLRDCQPQKGETKSQAVGRVTGGAQAVRHREQLRRRHPRAAQSRLRVR